jgi:hypothetical protein
MKRYRVHFRNKKDTIYHAFAFSLKDGNYYFHKKEDKSDFESFAVADQVTGIDEAPSAQMATPISIE